MARLQDFQLITIDKGDHTTPRTVVIHTVCGQRVCFVGGYSIQNLVTHADHHNCNGPATPWTDTEIKENQS